MFHRRCRGAFVALCLPLLALPALASPFDTKSDLFLKQELERSRRGWSATILTLDAPLETSRLRQLARLGVDVRRRFPRLKAVAARIPRRQLDAVARLAFVRRLSADVPLQRTDEHIIEATGAALAWSAPAGFGYTGQGVSIAIVDSGVDTLHPDLFVARQRHSRVVARANFVTCEADQDSPTIADRCGHGTHVAGIAAGNGALSSDANAYRRFTGIAPQASIVSARVLNRLGQGSVSDTIAAIEWVIANQQTHNIRVLNFSAGHPVGESYRTDPLCQALERAWRAGITVVCSAGNQGRLYEKVSRKRDNEGFGTRYGSVQSPANDPLVITVGAMKQGSGDRGTDRIATYSSRGPSRIDFVMKPDLVAPGNRVVSLNPYLGTSYLSTNYGATNALPWSAYRYTSTDTASRLYYVLSGTSMAAPVVAGAAALLIQQDPTITPDTVKLRLMLAADKWTQPDGTPDPLTYGAGYLNIPAALSLGGLNTRLAAVTPALYRSSDGLVSLDASAGFFTPFGTARIIWGTDGLVDISRLWGEEAFQTRIIWGTTDYYLTSSRLLWGSEVWGDLVSLPVGSSAADLSATTLYGE
jgi:serine protease AprX